jgi:hypothetical protein
VHRLLGDLQQPRVQPALRFGGILALAAAHPVDLLEDTSRAAHPAAEDVTDARERLLHERLRPLDQAGQHAHPVAKQPAVGRMVNGGLDTGAINAQLARAADLGLLGQPRRAVGEGLEGLRTDGLRPAQQGRLVGHVLEIGAAEPAQDQRIGHPLHGLLVTPRIEMPHDEQAREDLGGRRVPTMDQREAVAVGEVGAHLLIQLVVVEQPVQLDEHGIGLVSEFRHPGEHVFGGIAVDEHPGASVISAGGPSFDHLPPAPIRMNPAFGAPKLHR